jgi:succinyl-diaminopimelate desuccinylase
MPEPANTTPLDPSAEDATVAEAPSLSAEDARLLEEADAFIDENWESIVDDIAELVAVPSVVDDTRATDADPNGPEAHAGLRCALGIAERLGMQTTDDGGQIGWADITGQSPTQLALICHSDVVSPNVGWSFDPWTVTRKDGFLIGRGVLDDKGPLVISLHALAFIARRAQAAGKPLPYTLRMIVGTNEEVGMADVHYYLDHYDAPAFVFTPDADFPVCYGEKGQFGALFTTDVIEGGRIVCLTTQDGVTNAVPGRAIMVVRADAATLPATEHIQVYPLTPDEAAAFVAAEDGGPVAPDVEATDVRADAEAHNGTASNRATMTDDDATDNGNTAARHVGSGPFAKIVATGKGGHASLPEGMHNAIGILAHYALDQWLCNPQEEQFLTMLTRLTDAPDGSMAGIACKDEHFGELTSVAGTVHQRRGRFEVTLDVRYPTCTDGASLLVALEEVGRDGGCTVRCTRDEKPFLMDPDGPIVTTLVKTYRDATGFDGEPFTIGGGTYARAFPCASSFGPEDAHDHYPDWVGPMHGADEGVAETSLKRAFRIYVLAIDRLLRMDLGALGA